MIFPEREVLSGFDFAELESPDFKEDSVREELVEPFLNALGTLPLAQREFVRVRP
jgi:hypothetical protein